MPDGRSLFDTFHTEWTLLVLGPDPADTSAFEQAAASMFVDLKVVHQPSVEILDLYEAPMVLIRPDQIVAWRALRAQQGKQEALAVLSQVLGGSATVQG